MGYLLNNRKPTTSSQTYVADCLAMKRQANDQERIINLLNIMARDPFFFTESERTLLREGKLPSSLSL